MDKQKTIPNDVPVNFQNREIRRQLVDDEWFFSVVDVVGALTDSANPRDYWFKMKQRVQLEDGLELSTICRQLKMVSSDGKRYNTDCANVAKNARRELESKTGKSVVTGENFLPPDPEKKKLR